MTKNVKVVDENGTYVGTTYPKRARGLVKNGRAFFVDDCTICLSAKTEPPDHKMNESEVKQMNYIYFNPREWSLDQSQYNTSYQNGNGFYQQNFNTNVKVDRSFINDFDGSLVECLMLGGWDDACVRVSSGALLLPPDSENCFVFWLNGGENDRNNETCQLQITFFGNMSDCYTYKLNRNYIKPLLHKQGWELYSISFKTPFSDQTTVDTRLSFVSGNAPMAVKPARELSFYSEWEDEPDEFAACRPQRHNMVFEDGWPSIDMYGGDKYSTEILRRKKGQDISGHSRQVIQGVAENVQQMAQGLATNAKQMAKGFAQSSRQVAEIYKENVAQRKNQTDEWTKLSGKLEEYQKRYSELDNCQKELMQRCQSLQSRYKYIQVRYSLKEEQKAQLDKTFGETTEWDTNFSALFALNTQFSCAFEFISKKCVPAEAAEGVLKGIKSQLDSIENICNTRNDILNKLNEQMDKIENEKSLI